MLASCQTLSFFNWNNKGNSNKPYRLMINECHFVLLNIKTYGFRLSYSANRQRVDMPGLIKNIFSSPIWVLYESNCLYYADVLGACGSTSHMFYINREQRFRNAVSETSVSRMQRILSSASVFFSFLSHCNKGLEPSPLFKHPRYYPSQTYSDSFRGS